MGRTSETAINSQKRNSGKTLEGMENGAQIARSAGKILQHARLSARTSRHGPTTLREVAENAVSHTVQRGLTDNRVLNQERPYVRIA
jgi:hypothetical protein